MVPDRPDAPAWCLDAGERLASAYCLTLVRGLGVTQTLARLGADTSDSVVIGLPDLVRAAYGDERGAGWQLAGAAQLPGWTLVLEPNGFACTSKSRVRRASAETTIVTLYRHDPDVHELTVWHGRRVASLDLGGRSGALLVEHLTGVVLSVALVGRLSYRTAWFCFG